MTESTTLLKEKDKTQPNGNDDDDDDDIGELYCEYNNDKLIYLL